MLPYIHPQCLLDRGRINNILHINSTEAILQEIFFLKLQIFLLGFFFSAPVTLIFATPNQSWG